MCDYVCVRAPFLLIRKTNGVFLLLPPGHSLSWCSLRPQFPVSSLISLAAAAADDAADGVDVAASASAAAAAAVTAAGGAGAIEEEGVISAAEAI